MIKLTDYTYAQLRLFSGIIGKEIELTKGCIEKAKQWIPEGELLDDVIKNDADSLVHLREFHVHLLTAKDIKRGVELVASN